MQTEVMKWFDLQAPIFAFSHCRDVVAAVCRAGGMAALGTTHMTAEQLELELKWLDEHTDGKPYAVDVMFASKNPEDLEGINRPEDVEHLIPQGHKDWVENLLKEYNVPEFSQEEKQDIFKDYMQGMVRTHAKAKKSLEVVYQHPLAKMIVSALGPPPPDVMEEAHSRGLKVAALVGHPKHVKYHKQAGVDMLVCCGYEAGGHTGDIATFVLTPQVVEAAHPIPVLHAGGVGRGKQIAAALALGAQGVWTGTIWLSTAESEATPLTRKMIIEGQSDDTLRSKCGTGKYARRLKSRWVTAWEEPDAPEPLGMPLQSILINEALERMNKFQPEGLFSYPSGQVIGMIDHESDVRTVMYELLMEFGETMEYLEKLYKGDE